MSKKLFYNSLSSTLLFATSIIIAFIMSPVLIHTLGNRDYGLWELIMSVIGYMGLLDLGVGGTLIRFISVADGRKDRDDLQKTISTAFVFFIGVSLLAVLIMLGLGHDPQIIVGDSVTEIANLKTVLLLLTINVAFLFPHQVFVATLMGLQRHLFINSIKIVLAITQAVILYYLLVHLDVNGLIILALLTPIFTIIKFMLFSGAVLLDKTIPGIKLKCVHLSKVRELAAFAGKNATMLVASRLQNQSVPLIIAHVIGLSYIVYFVIPNRLVGYAKNLSQAIGFPLTPYFGSAVGKGDNEGLVKSWLDTSLALQVVSLAAPVVIFFTGVPFIRLWIGEEYAIAGKIIIYILLFGLVADALTSNAFRMLTAKDRHGRCALMWLVLATISIPIGILGGHVWGVAGVALGTTLVTVLASFITLMMACEVLKVSIYHYFQSTVFKLILPLTFLGVTLMLMHSALPITNYYHFVSHLALAGLIYSCSLWFLVLPVQKRDYVIDTLLVKIKVKK